MNILSCFDGMACGRIALERAGIQVDKYFASEIDKHAISIAQKNYPDIIQLGDVEEWRSWKLPKIDLLLGGSPCQGLSFAGKRLNFDDPRSKLFFVYVKILKSLKRKNPDLLFLLENVMMKQKQQDIISEMLGVSPVLIDSALVSAQSRRRLYWTNIPNVTIPEDRGIRLVDIMESDVPDTFVLSPDAVRYMNRKVKDGRTHWDFAHYSDSGMDKSHAVVTNLYKGVPYNVLIDRRLNQVGSLYKNNADAGRVYDNAGLARTLKGESGGMGGKMGLYQVGDVIRKLTPVECERLQTVPECDIIDSLWLHIMNISNQSKICVPVEILSGRLAKLVGDVERGKLSKSAKLVTKSLWISNPLNEFIARPNADMRIEVQISKYMQKKFVELLLSADNVENLLQFRPHTAEEISALCSAFTNSIEAKIIVGGQVVLHLRDKNLSPLQNGETLLSRFGNEITKPVDGVVYINPNQSIPTMFTTLSPLLLVQRVERIQTILYFYAQHAIDGHILKKMLIDGCWICPETNNPIQIIGYTDGVSNTQRYRMLGNGWTVDVIAHILKGAKS